MENAANLQHRHSRLASCGVALFSALTSLKTHVRNDTSCFGREQVQSCLSHPLGSGFPLLSPSDYLAQKVLWLLPKD